MLDSFNTLKNRKGITTYYSLSIHFSNEELFVNGLEIKEEKDSNFTVKNRFEKLSIESFVKEAKGDYPVLLNIEGDVIVSKKIKNEDGYRRSLIFRGDIDEYFFYEQHEGDDVFVSYCKTEIVEELIANFLEKDFFVTRVSLGSFGVKNLIPFLDHTNEIKTTHHKLKFNGNRLYDYDASIDNMVNEYRLQEHVFSSELITALSAYFGKKMEADNDTLKQILVNKQEISFKRIFKKLGLVFLVIIISSLVFGHFIKKHKAMLLYENQSEISFIQQNKEMLSALDNDRKYKEEVLFSSGFNKAETFSKQIAQITNLIPDEILLTKLVVQPLSRKLKTKENIEIVSKTIVISGICSNDKALDEWISSLNEIDWISKVSNISYERDQNFKNVFEFNIKTL